MKTKHTQQNWVIRKLAGFPLQIATEQDTNGFGKPIADICYNNHDNEANAALIAAAPELLEAVKLCLEFWDTPPTGKWGPDDAMKKRLQDAKDASRAAIQKATGEA